MGSIDIKLEERYKDLSGYITIRDIESDYTCQFPVSAPGIEAGQIMWIGQVVNLRRGITWNDKGKKLILDQEAETSFPLQMNWQHATL